MLAKISVILSTWFLLSVIVGFLVEKAISALGNAHALGLIPPAGWDNVLKEEDTLVLVHAQM